MDKRWIIGLAVLVVLLILFRDAPLVRAMGGFVGAIVNLIGAILGLLWRTVAAV